MAEAGTQGPAPVDLERELTCSICTDLLYQPLTLLDCLHTFCGACLKEWFAFQATTATSLHPYTCPSCRASVRSTQPNATVTTLLDMFIQANPHRGKTDEEKKVDREKFRYGDVIMPKLRRRGAQDDDEERRVLEEVQQLSLREVGIDTSSTIANVDHLEPPRERRRRERSEGRRERSSDTRRSADGRSRSRNQPSASASTVPREAIAPRVIEHQSSLRSLLSASDLDSQEMEEEIMRQIMEEGLLDGIDLNNIDVAQEDEISERIAQAYRRRQDQKRRERRERRERLAREGRIVASGTSTPDVRSPAVRADENQRLRAHSRSTSTTPTPRDRDNRPPLSRPGLLDVANQGPRTRHTRSSSQGSSRSAREHRPTPLAASSTRSHNNSQPELVGRSVSSGTGTDERRQSDNEHRSALEGRQQFRNSISAHPSSNPNSPRRSAFHFAPPTESPTSTTPVIASPLASPLNTLLPLSPHPISSSSRRTTDPTRHPLALHSHTPPLASPPAFPRSTTDPSAAHPSQEPLPPTSASAPLLPLFAEPHITCQTCEKDHIEYALHYNCSRCASGTYNICQPCYRLGKGCKHWFGFGWAAWPAYLKKAPEGGYPAGHDYPHIMRGHRYRRPEGQLTQTVGGVWQSDEDPAGRLEAGVFCDSCGSWANACYWKCDYCNEGEWGFCNECVNRGFHCTHALLPISHVARERLPPPSSSSSSSSPSNTPSTLDVSPPTTPPLTPRAASLVSGRAHVTLANSTYRPLTFTTLCNICTYPIPPSHTRFHCPTCNDGDYDICTPCYLSARLPPLSGPSGYRRCLHAHRMTVIGFEDRDGGQRRVVVRNLVGGYALREDAPPAQSPQSTSHNASSSAIVPPDGGVGLRIQARWSYFPNEGVEDELMFPKFAEITEAEDINGDWCWGVYAGRKGLFPGGYGRVVGGRGEREGRI